MIIPATFHALLDCILNQSPPTWVDMHAADLYQIYGSPLIALFHTIIRLTMGSNVPKYEIFSLLYCFSVCFLNAKSKVNFYKIDKKNLKNATMNGLVFNYDVMFKK